MLNPNEVIDSLEDRDKVIIELCHRVTELEGCLVYVRNFLPAPLKLHAESILWPQKNNLPSGN